MTPRRVLRRQSQVVGLFGPRRPYAGNRRPWLLYLKSSPASPTGTQPSSSAGEGGIGVAAGRGTTPVPASVWNGSHGTRLRVDEGAK